MITVKRQTGIVGAVMKLDVYINGEKWVNSKTMRLLLMNYQLGRSN